MAERIVVGLVTHAVSTGGLEGEAYLAQVDDLREAAAYLARVDAVCKKAAASGARLCACEASSIAFDFAPDRIGEAIDFAVSVNRSDASASSPWNAGIAQGEVRTILDAGKSGAFVWGPPLVTAMALARMARNGQVLADPALPCVARGELLAGDWRYGRDGTRKIRGLVLDERRTWRRDATANVARLIRPELVGRQADLKALLASQARVSIVRADPGCGGTRMLEEVMAAVAPARSLLLAPAGAEPLGSLRRAFFRASPGGVGGAVGLPKPLAAALDRLLAGDGVDPRSVGALVVSWVTAPRGGTVLVDDVLEVDDPSLEVVVSAAKRAPGLFRLVVRVDATSPLPAVFDAVGTTPCITIEPLAVPEAEQLVGRCATGGVSTEAAKRWARRGRCIPLAMVEAFAGGVTGGEIAWVNDVAVPRNRRAGLGPRLAPADWIADRFTSLSDPEIVVLDAVALLGTEVPLPLLRNLVGAVSPAVDVSGTLKLLEQSRLVRMVAPGICALPSRSHRDVALSRIAEDDLRAWHAAACEAIYKGSGRFAHAEAARHAALANDFGRAAALARDAAQAAWEHNLGVVEQALRTFADEAESMGQPGAAGAAPRGNGTEAESRGDRAGAPGRLRAIASLAEGSKSDALRLLRDDVKAKAAAPPAARARANLAYAVGLAIAGNPTEALLHALTALAWARQAHDSKGQQASTRFLARLSAAAGAPEAALAWQRVEAAASSRRL